MGICGKIAKILLVAMMTIILGSCEKPRDRREATIEAGLAKSFRDESPAAQQKIAEIIKDGQARNYKIALNKLALFSASRLLTRQQRFDVAATMRILRYNMEEDIFAEQARRKHKKSQE